MKNENYPSIITILRQRVEELLKNKAADGVWHISEDETMKLLEEIEKHQIELELQNKELIAARSAAQDAAEKYTELYDFSPSFYFTLFRDGRIVELNLSGSELIGKERKDLINFPFDYFVSDETKPIFNHFLKRVFSSTTRETCEVTLFLKWKSVNIDLLLTGIMSRNEEHCLIAGVDITQHHRIEELLRKNEKYLKETQVIAQLGTYTTDISTGKWDSSEVLDAIFGVDADFDKTYEAWTSIIHPDWKKPMEDYFRKEVLGNKVNFDKEYKIIRRNDKAERWVHGLGRLKFDQQNRPVMMVGTIRDITEHKQAIDAIKRSQVFLMSSLESLKNMIILFGDQNYRYLYFNKAHLDSMKNIHNLEIKVGMNILDCISSEKERKIFKDNYDHALKGESRSNTRIADDHESSYYENFFNPILNDENEIIGVTIMSMNITDRKRVEIELEKWINMFKPKAN